MTTNPMETTVAIHTLGCKVNQSDGVYLEGLLRARNFRLVDFKEKADIYIINTCTVTDAADQDSRNMIRRTKRRNPDGFTIVTGCYAQTRPEEVARVEGVDLVLGNDKKSKLLEYLELGRPRDPLIEVDNIFLQTELESFGLASYSKNTRAFVKIQDGCNQFCTFCIIPYARGRNRSIPIPQVLAELRSLSERGFQEAVLTGIHIGTYGQDLAQPTSLTELLVAIDRERPIHRVRVSSVDPEEITSAMIELLTSSPALCPHLHIPLQSGDNATLQMMRRRYDREKFAQVCEQLVQRRDDFCIGTDVIVGFPYEDSARFLNTLELLKNVPVHYLHVFPFSPKRGTRAAKMLGQVSSAAKKSRVEQLRTLSSIKQEAFYRACLGNEVEVVLEQTQESCQNDQKEEQSWFGHSENYLPVTLPLAQANSGQIFRCRLERLSGGNLVGKALA